MAEEAVVTDTLNDDNIGPDKDTEAGEKEHIEGEHAEGEHIEGEQIEGEHVTGEHIESEHVEGEQGEGEQVESEQVEGEQTEGEQAESEHVAGEGEEVMGEELEGEETGAEEQKQEEPAMEEVVEEEVYVEEPPPDPAAPFDLSDSKELLKELFDLRPDQLAEVEQLWELYQNYTPAYTDIQGYITEKELIYMLKCLLLMTYTPEQLQELIAFCVRPPHPKGHITFDQFLNMVTIRQRDFPIEEELRTALMILDPEKTGMIDREYFREVVGKLGHKMTQKSLDALIKEVDLSNDGTLGIEDIIGTMCIDLNKDDIIMLRNALNPDDAPPARDEEDI